MSFHGEQNFSKRSCGFAAGVALALSTAFTAGPVSAAGFFVRENSTSAMMTSFAGATAFAYDPSYQIYNPATLADLPGRQFTVDLKAFLPSAVIDVRAANSPAALGYANLIGLGDSGKMVGPAASPTAFGSWQITDRFTAGLGFYAPFAVLLKPRPVWAGEYQLFSTKMTDIDVQVSGTYRITDWLAAGGAINIERYRADLRQVEFVNVSSEGFVRGSDTRLGYDFGLTITPADGTRIGLNYRSAIDHALSGAAGVTTGPPDRAQTSFTTPDFLTLGLSQKITDDLTLLADAGWTGWSKFDGFRVDLASSPEQVRSENWRDTWHGAVGVRYALNDGLTLGAGVLFDQGAARNSSDSFSPDADRVEMGVGVEKRLSGDIHLAFALSRLKLDDAPIDTVEASGGNAGTSLKAVFKCHLDTIGLSLTASL